MYATIKKLCYNTNNRNNFSKNSMKPLDKKSLEKAYPLFETNDISTFEIGTTKGLPYKNNS